MDPIISDRDQMTEIYSDTCRFGSLLPRDLIPGIKGNGLMVWDDEAHCIFLDFFGEFSPGERLRATTAALETYDGLRLPYSLRVGFHQSEEIARQTMEGWFGFNRPEVDEVELSEPQIHQNESKMG